MEDAPEGVFGDGESIHLRLHMLGLGQGVEPVAPSVHHAIFAIPGVQQTAVAWVEHAHPVASLMLQEWSVAPIVLRSVAVQIPNQRG